MEVTFIGGGNMANAMVGGLLQKGFAAKSLCVVDLSAEARDNINNRFGVAAYADLNQTCAEAGVFILAVKPQQMHEAVGHLKPLLKQQLVISIAAGIRTADLSRWLGGYSRIVRVMPNTPALVLSGFSGLYAMPAVTETEKRQTEAILGAVGATLWLEREEQLDAITALTGSGPAYVFYFIEALQQAAKELGFDANQARQLALAAFSGAVKLASQGEDAQALRSRVTSKGGTTERAIEMMDEAKIKQHIIDAVRAAARRSRELGDEFGTKG